MDIGDIIVPVVIVIIMVGKVIKGVMEQAGQRPDLDRSPSTGDWQGWEEWNPTSASSPPPVNKAEPKDQAKPPPVPSSLAEVIRTLAEKQDEQVAGPARNVVVKENIINATAEEEARARFEGYRQESAALMEQELPSASQVANESLATAFPEAVRKATLAKSGKHRTIVLKAQGRQTLRQAILMREVLTQPRAFDI